MRRPSPRQGILAALALAVLAVAWLLPEVRGDAERYERARARITALEVAHGRLRELTIGLRHGIGANYDEGNAWLARILAEQTALAAEIDHLPALHAPWQAYREAEASLEQHWEDFKLGNAVVRNSLRYFQSDALAFMRALPATAEGNRLRQQLATVSQQLLMRALGEVGGAVGDGGLTWVMPPPSAAGLSTAARDELTRLARHAELIARSSPALERDLAAILHGDGRARLAALAAANHRLLLAEQQRVERYRVGLLLAIGVLSLALAWLAVRYVDSLRQRERDLRLAGTVFDSSHQGIVVTDRDGNIVRVNQAYCAMTGYAESELLGRNPRILRSGQQDAGFYRALWQRLLVEGRWQGEMHNRRRNGAAFVQWINIDAVDTDAGERLYVGIASDVSELVESRERLSSLAYFDTLTGLPNRFLFHDRLRHGLARARRERGSLALLFLDLDNFKNVNDTLGHAAGDELLVEIARRLRACVREADTVARLGGDEFALLLPDPGGPENTAAVAGEITRALAAPCRVHGYEIVCGASVGITFYPADGVSAEQLLRNADVAMYRAKDRGRGTFQFFTEDMAAAVAETLRIENGLRNALSAGELELHYQPQFAQDGRVTGLEALLRWNSAELGPVAPARFIPVAEKSGLITDLGCFALREACRQCAEWRARLDPALRVAVNLSAAQFRHDGLAERIAEILAAHALPGDALELEITESVVMEDVARGQDVLRRLKRMGCRIAIDDFGTGYSSLAYLRRFPVDVLKIDKTFVDGLGIESDDTAVVEAVIGLARSLRMGVVAEGVETRAQLLRLHTLAGGQGFAAQGYLLARPQTPAEFAAGYAALAASYRALAGADGAADAAGGAVVPGDNGTPGGSIGGGGGMGAGSGSTGGASGRG
jgi:diguanylate cyclase (GGDEF)-like protein/PAS domain S-box-containing protein